MSTRSLRYIFSHVAFYWVFLTGREKQCIHINCEKVSSQTVWAFTPGKASASCLFVWIWHSRCYFLAFVSKEDKHQLVETVPGHQALKISQKKNKSRHVPIVFFNQILCVSSAHHTSVHSILAWLWLVWLHTNTTPAHCMSE